MYYSIPLLHFSYFAAQWKLENPFWGSFLASTAREAVEEDWILGLKILEDQNLTFVVGPKFQYLNYEQQKQWVYKCCLHLVLGHLDQDILYYKEASWAMARKMEVFSRMKMEDHLFPRWITLLKNIAKINQLSLVQIQQQIKAKELDTQFPDLANSALKYEQYWSNYKADSSRFFFQFNTPEENLKGAGIPKYLEEFIIPKKTSTQTNWQRILRNTIQRSAERKIQNTIKRPSKRFGTTPGIKIRNHARIALILDTSASVAPDTFGKFYYEIKGIAQLGYRLTIVEADVVVQRIYPFHGQIKSKDMKGRGGTAYDQPLEKTASIIKPDMILYFTDGGGPIPYTNVNIPLLWCLVYEKKIKQNWEAFPGKKLYIPSNNLDT